MTNEVSGTVVLTDAAGTYYVLTPELLAEAQATSEHRAAIEADVAGEDTSGFIFLHEIITVATSPAATILVYNDLAAGRTAVQTTSVPRGEDTRGFANYENIGGNLAGPIILNVVNPALTIAAVPVINERR